MKKIFTFLFALSIAVNLNSQSPEKMSYQAVIRNSSNELVRTGTVRMRISILQGSANGTSVYSEIQTPVTNSNGLVTLEIGGGSGFNTINWSSGLYFIKTETDPTGGTNYTITGTSQLLSVPYAMYAKTSGNGFSGNYTDLSNKPVLFDGNYNSLLNTPVLFNGAWNGVTGKPTTVTGYGITDAMTNTHVSNGITSTNVTNWTTAYGWGNHAGLYRPVTYVPSWSEVTGKPILATIATSGNYSDLNNLPVIPTQYTDVMADARVVAGIADKVDKESGKVLSTNDYTTTEKTKLAAITGTNTGDQDITAITHSNRVALDDVTGVNTGDQVLPTLSGLGGVAGNPAITGETKTKVTYDSKGLVTAGTDATTADIAASPDKNYITDSQQTVLTNTSGTNTGDQNGSETKVTAGVNSGIIVNGSGTTGDPYVVNNKTYAIGDTYCGGIVFYVYDGGRHGLIASTTNQGRIRFWGGVFTNTMSRADGVGAGKVNTALIIASQGIGDGATYAARVCNEYSVTVDGVKYAEWYLPSQFELNLLYIQRNVVGNIVGDNYWSSTEWGLNDTWNQYFGSGGGSGSVACYTKSYTNYIRPIRSF